MATRSNGGRNGTNGASGKPRGRLFCAIERAILGFGMSLVGFVVEHQLLRALKKGLDRAPRTAEESETYREEVGVGTAREAGLSPSAKEIGDQADR